MKLGIMQPYFFPYLGYFDLINQCDRWVVFDVVEYSSKSWINRNRILHPKEGWQYFSVPVDKRTEGRAIKDVVIIDKDATKNRILGQITHYRQARAPYYSAVRGLIERSFDETESNKLCDLNVRSLALACSYMGIAFESTNFSEMNVALPPIEHAGQWALEISAALGASEYINPPNGRPIFREAEFLQRNIQLSFTTLVDFRYDTNGFGFVDHLSIVDVLMWNDPSVVKAYLDTWAQRPQI